MKADSNNRILVVDDNAAIHEDFRKIFGSAGEGEAAVSKAETGLFGEGAGSAGHPVFQMDAAYQGQEALERVRQALAQGRPYAMVFMDVRMPPGWDGIETTARIWKIDPDLQVVICTAYSDYSWSDMLQKLGLSDRLVILKKPFDNIEVLQLASALTEKWRLTQLAKAREEGLERAVAERTRELARVNRALKTLSAGNSAVVHAESEQQLFGDICRAVVAGGDYRLAWIGLAHHDAEKSVSIMAHAGDDHGLLASAGIRWADGADDRWPCVNCIRTGVTQIQHPAARLRDPGVRSCIGLPLKDPAGVLGALVIDSTDPDAFDANEQRLLEQLADEISYGVVALRTRTEQIAGLNRLQQSMVATVHALANTLEIRDPYTAGHQRRVAGVAVAIAQLLGLPVDRLLGLDLAASIHDIGKLVIPAEILCKPGHLTPVEYDLIKTHAVRGADILRNVEFPWPIRETIWQHHERMDGSGYPRGLKGEEIQLEARIIAVADTIESIATSRPYRPARGLVAGLAEIERCRGTLFDVQVVDACLKLFREKGYELSASAGSI